METTTTIRQGTTIKIARSTRDRLRQVARTLSATLDKEVTLSDAIQHLLDLNNAAK